MEGANNSSPEQFEDRIRRMVLSGGNASTSPETIVRPRPKVRLPPSVAHGPPQRLAYGQAPSLQDVYNQTWQSGGPGNMHAQFAPRANVQLPPNQQPIRYNGPHSTHQAFQQPRQGYQSPLSPSPGGVPSPPRIRSQQPMQLGSNAFQRNGFSQRQMATRSDQHQLFSSRQLHGSLGVSNDDSFMRQVHHMEQLAAVEIPSAEISQDERHEKEAFREALQNALDQVCRLDPERLPEVLLECFGSFKSGFAAKGSDMDLVVVIPGQASRQGGFSLLEGDLPRVLEKKLLQLGYGARLLSKTRVPIIKVCEKPDADLLGKLRDERELWDRLPDRMKYPHLYPNEVETGAEEGQPSVETVKTDDGASNPATPSKPRMASITSAETDSVSKTFETMSLKNKRREQPHIDAQVRQEASDVQSRVQNPNRESSKAWARERKAGPLDFPKQGVGIQSDINFFNPLGLHNTQLLRCYSLCDGRVKPMMLFVKTWAKRRKINSSYSGTLSSYGYVLMVLHYLVNCTQPPALPNLQSPWRPVGPYSQHGSYAEVVDNWNVTFWRNEAEITDAARRGLMSNNRESLGALLAGFFHYYSSQGGSRSGSFQWMQEVLSLRSPGGLLSKESKGWVKSVTEESEGRKVQHRYLFCIEDPFELRHNVARTVTHNGIVAIRDEFRRARRILNAIGDGMIPRDGDLFAELLEGDDETYEKPRHGNFTQHGTPTITSNGSFEGSTAFGGGKLFGSPHPRPNSNRVISSTTPIKGPIATAQPSKPRPLNIGDNSAFPTLGSAKKGKQKTVRNGDGYGEISGDRAKAFLEEVKKKKKAEA